MRALRRWRNWADMDYAAMLERLAAIPAFADKKRQKQDMLKVLECLGNPQKQIRAVHVAGTKARARCAHA